MKRLFIIVCSIHITLLFSQCGTTSKENNNESSDTVKVDDMSSKPSSEIKTNALTNMTFAYGMNMQNCDGVTYSEYSIDLKFSNGNTVKQVTNDIVGMGSPDAYIVKKTLIGTYTINNDLVTIEYTKMKEESIRDEKVFKSSTEDYSKTALKLKMTKCEDGRLQLVSSVEGVSVLGEKAIKGDKSSWSLAKKKQ
ncbi:hypothetical protein BKI52_29315 [marine bacterium AO1-C]|nr:hypothetical protein BKI52_29315 [marine bacterium AO1-C]